MQKPVHGLCPPMARGRNDYFMIYHIFRRRLASDGAKKAVTRVGLCRRRQGLGGNQPLLGEGFGMGGGGRLQGIGGRQSTAGD